MIKPKKDRVGVALERDDLPNPDGCPVWWVGTPKAEACLAMLRKGIIPPTTYVFIQGWYAARSETCIDLQLTVDEVECVKQSELI